MTFRVTRIKDELLLVIVDPNNSRCWFGLEIDWRRKASLLEQAAGLMKLFFLELILVEGFIFFHFRCFQVACGLSRPSNGQSFWVFVDISAA